MLERAIAVASMPIAPISILMYGKNRTGKTTVACQAEKPLLVVSFEPADSAGIESVRKIPGVYVVRIAEPDAKNWNRSTEEAVMLASELAQGSAHNYKSVVVDSTSSMQDRILQELMQLPAVPDQQSWGTVQGDLYIRRSEKLRELIRPFLNLKIPTKIFLSKEKDHNPPVKEEYTKSGKLMPDMRPKFLRGLQTESFIGPDIGGATVGWLQDACDCVTRLFIEEEQVKKKYILNGKAREEWRTTGKYAHYLRLKYHPNFAAGIRSCNPENVPEVMTMPTAELLFKELMRIIKE